MLCAFFATFALGKTFSPFLFRIGRPLFPEKMFTPFLMKNLLLIFLMMCSVASVGAAARKNAVADSIRAQLHFANTPGDSLKILYDLFDVENSASQRVANGRLLYDVAVRAGDVDARLDMLRQLAAALTKHPEAYHALRKEADKIKSHPELKDTKLFLDLYVILTNARNSSEEMRQKQLAGIIAKAEKNNGDWYTQVKDLYTVCAYLSLEGTKNLLADYLEKLEKKILERPNLLYAVKNFYYTSAAIHFTDAGRPVKAVGADRKLLEIIAGLEKMYRQKHRSFRNYDVQKYVSYRRMLHNYKALNPSDVEKYHNAAVALARKNPAVEEDFMASPRVEAYFALATRQYGKALPLLRKAIDTANPNNHSFRRALLEMLMEAAKGAGDNNVLAAAREEYDSLMQATRGQANKNLYRELQIKYDIDQLRAKNAALEIEKRDSQLAANGRIIWIVSVALAVVVVLLLVMAFYYRRTRTLSRNLAIVVGRLEKERDTLDRMQTQLIKARDKAEAANVAKDEFLHSISHEIRTPLNAIMGFSRLIAKKVPETLSPKFKLFSKQIVSNTEMLEALINDILYLSSLEKHVPETSVETTSASTFISLCAQWVAHKVAPSVYVDCRMPRPDILIRSDRGNIEEVLMKMLSNAAKFTAKGSIILECVDNAPEETISFIVTDTGTGIPEGYEEEIFERFVKLDAFKQGTGLGLYICRQIATALGGRIYVDASYKNGARFIFTLPKDPSHIKA